MSETQDRRQARQERIAREALPRWDALADDLHDVVEEVFTRRIPYDQDDGADVMVLSFVTKQSEHLRSVRVLVDTNMHRDAQLIARTMLEGLARLLWAFNQTPLRIERWLWFGAVLDWRQTLKNEADGMLINLEEKATLKNLVNSHGPNYYRSNVRKALQAAQENGTEYEIEDDPWSWDWTPTNVRDMFIEVRAEKEYDSMYRNTSEWVHWGPRAMLRAMQPAEWGMAGFTDEDPLAAVTALFQGCRCLLQSLEVLDQQFEIGLVARLTKLNQKMDSIISDSIEMLENSGQH